MTIPHSGGESPPSSEGICILAIGSDHEFMGLLRSAVLGHPNLSLIQADSLDEAMSNHAFRECDLVILDTREGPEVAVRYLRESGAHESFAKPTIFVASEGVSAFHTEVEVVTDTAGIADAVIRFVDRSRHEHTLAESERMYRDLFDRSGDAMFIHEPGGKFIAVNKEACSSLGYTREELLQLRPEDIDGPESKEKVKERTSQLLLKGEVEFEASHKRKDGSSYPVEIKLRKFSYIGRPAIIADVRDISERKRAQENLRRANEKLTLLGAMTRHDISNRLASMKGYIGLSEQDGVSDSLKDRYMQKVKESLEAIEEQLRFAGDYQKAGTSDPIWTNVGETIDSVIKSFDFQNVVVSPDLHQLELYADPMLERVFWNLLDNAKRHGNGVTTVRFRAEPRGDRLVLVVEDDGQGIPENEKERIFEQGYGRHTGMGLFLIKEVLAITGISVSETGVHGEGARFEMALSPGNYRFPPS